MYTLSTYPRDPNFALFFSTTSHFQVTMLSKIGKIGKAPTDLRMTLNTSSQRYPVHANLPLRPKFRSVSLYDQPFSRYMYKVLENQEIGNTSNDLKMILNTQSQKYPVHTKHLPCRPNFGSFHSKTSHFQDIRHFIIPHPRKEQSNKHAKTVKNSKFEVSQFF